MHPDEIRAVDQTMLENAHAKDVEEVCPDRLAAASGTLGPHICVFSLAEYVINVSAAAAQPLQCLVTHPCRHCASSHPQVPHAITAAPCMPMCSPLAPQVCAVYGVDLHRGLNAFEVQKVRQPARVSKGAS